MLPIPKKRAKAAISLLIGIVLGYVFAVMGARLHRCTLNTVLYHESRPRQGNDEPKTENIVDALDINILTNITKFDDLHQHEDDDRIAKTLHESVRVLCWVMTSQSNLQKRAKHVQATWGRRCNVLLFMSEVDDLDFPTVGLKLDPGHDSLATKTMKAFDYVYRHHFDDADWFLQADDDTYVILENLRYLLSAHAPVEPVYFGQLFEMHVKQGYFSGGAGYVLSKEALSRLVSRTPEQCEDVTMGLCMETLEVRTGNSRDRLDRNRFHALILKKYLHGDVPDWYKDFDEHSNTMGIETISDYPIIFHYMQPKGMYILEYFVYHASVHGVLRGVQELNP